MTNTANLFNTIKLLAAGFFLFATSGCHNTTPDTITLNFEKGLVPEGITIDEASGRVFLNSLTKNKIVTAHLDGSNATTFLESNLHGYLPGFGMLIKGDTLYALSNSLQKKENSSVLLLLNVKTKQLIAKYMVNHAPYAYLNDLAVSAGNQIYITDSESNRIYMINRPGETIELFLESEEVAHSNGIAISDDNTKLYLASSKGIRVVDLATKRIINRSNPDYAGIDGMKFYENSLIGMVEDGVYRYYLNESGTEIKNKKQLIAFDKSFKSPTTLAISGNQVYFIKNTQLDNFNDSTGQIIDSSRLEALILLKKKIE